MASPVKPSRAGLSVRGVDVTAHDDRLGRQLALLAFCVTLLACVAALAIAGALGASSLSFLPVIAAVGWVAIKLVKLLVLRRTCRRIDRLLADLRRLAAELDAQGRFGEVAEIIVSAGGSIFFDRVIAALGGPWQLSRPVRVVLRSGAYVTHDAGEYDRLSPFAGRASGTEPERLEQALELWAIVQSIPEPGLAVLGFGKRDAAHDRGFPVPFAALRDSGSRPLTPGELTIVALNDQHARARLAADSPLRVGDLVGLHVSHPCTSFDKFRFVPLVDDAYRVREMIRCYL